MFTRSKYKWLSFAVMVLSIVSFWVVMRSVAYTQPATTSQANQANGVEQLAQANTPRKTGVPLSPQEKTEIVNKFFNNPQVSQRTRNQRIKVLSVVDVLRDKATPDQPSPPSLDQPPSQGIASIVLFNYSTGNATRYRVDALNGEVLSEETLRGRPQASPEERQEAIQIIQANPQHARLLQAGGIIEGGFIVDDPVGASPGNRFIQMHVLSSDRRRIQSVTIVDLTTGIIASSISE